MKSLILVSAVFGLLLTPASAETAKSSKQFAPGQKQTQPGQAKDFAPGQLQKKPGEAKKLAPGQQEKKKKKKKK